MLYAQLFWSWLSEKYSPFFSSLFGGCLQEHYNNQLPPTLEEKVGPFKILDLTLKVFIVNFIALISQILRSEITVCWQVNWSKSIISTLLAFCRKLLNILGRSCQVHWQKFYHFFFEENTLPIKKSYVHFEQPYEGRSIFKDQSIIKQKELCLSWGQLHRKMLFGFNNQAKDLWVL